MAVSPLLHQSHEGKSFMDFPFGPVVKLVHCCVRAAPRNNSMKNKGEWRQELTSYVSMRLELTVYRRTFHVVYALSLIGGGSFSFHGERDTPQRAFPGRAH